MIGKADSGSNKKWERAPASVYIYLIFGVPLNWKETNAMGVGTATQVAPMDRHRLPGQPAAKF